jgi:cAMP-specific phosphodiesterase 4
MSDSSGKLSALTASDITEQARIQKQQLSESLESASLRSFISSSTSKSTMNIPQGRLSHILAYEAGCKDSLDTGQEVLKIVAGERKDVSSSKLKQTSKSSIVVSAQERQKLGTSSFQLLSSLSGESKEDSVLSSEHSTVTAAVTQTKDVMASNQNPVTSKCSMTYLSASHEDYENIRQRRHLSRSPSPLSSSTASDISGSGLSPGRTVSTAKSDETSALGRESRQWLTATGSSSYSDTAKSMESLRSNSTVSSSTGTTAHHSHRQSFLTSSERDMRRVVASSVEAKSLENLEKEMRLMGKRKVVSGEDSVASVEESGMTAAERRRGLYAGVINPGERRITVPQHLSLPPPTGTHLSLATPGADRKLTILSPHSPLLPDVLHFSSSVTTLKTKRKKAMVLPRLILPRSESDVFLE